MKWWRSERLENAAWSIFGGLIGGGVGLFFSILWQRSW